MKNLILIENPSGRGVEEVREHSPLNSALELTRMFHHPRRVYTPFLDMVVEGNRISEAAKRARKRGVYNIRIATSKVKKLGGLRYKHLTQFEYNALQKVRRQGAYYYEKKRRQEP
jgi:hypothetical protein